MGFKDSFEELEANVFSNAGDMFEYYYSHAVIEKVYKSANDPRLRSCVSIVCAYGMNAFIENAFALNVKINSFEFVIVLAEHDKTQVFLKEDCTIKQFGCRIPIEEVTITLQSFDGAVIESAEQRS